MIPLIVRRSTQADEHFIGHSWLRARQLSPECAKLPNEQYRYTQQALIRYCLESADVVVLVAVADFDPSVIYGYLVYHPGQPEPVWAYVKKHMRGMGIYHRLLEESKCESKK